MSRAEVPIPAVGCGLPLAPGPSRAATRRPSRPSPAPRYPIVLWPGPPRCGDAHRGQSTGHPPSPVLPQAGPFLGAVPRRREASDPCCDPEEDRTPGRNRCSDFRCHESDQEMPFGTQRGNDLAGCRWTRSLAGSTSASASPHRRRARSRAARRRGGSPSCSTGLHSKSPCRCGT